MRLSHLVNDYLAHLEAERAPRYVKETIRQIRDFVALRQGVERSPRSAVADAERFLAEIREVKRSAKTRDHYAGRTARLRSVA
jgi:GTP cyclohydrolase III